MGCNTPKHRFKMCFLCVVSSNFPPPNIWLDNNVIDIINSYSRRLWIAASLICGVLWNFVLLRIAITAHDDTADCETKIRNVVRALFVIELSRMENTLEAHCSFLPFLIREKSCFWGKSKLSLSAVCLVVSPWGYEAGQRFQAIQISLSWLMTYLFWGFGSEDQIALEHIINFSSTFQDCIPMISIVLSADL